jgi:GTP-binding protein
VVLVMDIRHPFEPFDEMMIAWAMQADLRMHVLLNKADKLRHGASVEALRSARNRLDAAVYSTQLFSARTGAGREEAIELLSAWLTPPAHALSAPHPS